MTREEKQRYADAPVVAVFPMTNHGGIEILDANDEYVVYRFNFGTPQELHRAKVKIGTRHSSFRTSAGYSIRLDECMKVR